MSRPRILFVDAYDSYSNNIVALVQQSIPCHVTVVKMDESALQKADALATYLDTFDAVVAGPGPGSATRASDVGLIRQLWHLERPKPVLGVCLGHQSLACNFGASLERLPNPRHGTVATIQHADESIFAGLGCIRATTYNSLHVSLGHAKNASSRHLWSPGPSCPDLQPLAWALDDALNGPVCMALKHVSKPFWGVQYHPESICTNAEGAQIVRNWWHEAQRWSWQMSSRPPTPRSLSVSPPPSLKGSCRPPSPSVQPCRQVQWRRMPLGSFQTPDLCNFLVPDPSAAMVLESGTRFDGAPVNPETGRYSIISCTDGNRAVRFEFDQVRESLRHLDGTCILSETRCTMQDVWSTLKAFIDHHRAVDGPFEVPFWGGLVGLVSYEACLQTIDVQPTHRDEHPSIVFAFIDRCVVLDHVDKQLFVQTIRPNDSSWLDDVERLLDPQRPSARVAESGNSNSAGSEELTRSGPTVLKVLDADRYQKKVLRCQEHIRAGESYELCLTNQAHVQTQSTPMKSGASERQLYRKLRSTNPAPFGAWLRLPCGQQTLTVLSSSPERFLRWDRHGKCQFRPIKGTVKKGPGMSRTLAESILKSDKEQAENLMIVDLIRHDLHGVAGHDHVHVSKLMSMEEYETVYQLVSVVEGQLSLEQGQSGLNVLAASLPPGSMTGAPKKRSCELLQMIEDEPRGIYSGVLGYLDVGGGGDFSVVIRTAYKWDAPAGDSADRNLDQWHIGAGGAVTIQSTAQGEWEEMQAKRDALLGVFLGPG